MYVRDRNSVVAAWQGLACTREVGMGSLAAAGAFAGACYWLSIYPARPPSCTGRLTTQHLISVYSQTSLFNAPIWPSTQLCIVQPLKGMHSGRTSKPH